MDCLKQLKENHRLSFVNDAERFRNSYEWKELLNICYRKDWNVEIKYLAPVNKSEKQMDESTDNAISYFARYTNRTAIFDSQVDP